MLNNKDNVRWSECLPNLVSRCNNSNDIKIGILPGEGVGPEVISCALEVLDSVASVSGFNVDTQFGGPIGREAERLGKNPLSDEIMKFCQEVFDSGGVILNGPGGGRYVYDLRHEFRLFFKISPLQSVNGVLPASLSHMDFKDFDILITRENAAGVYQGVWSESYDEEGVRCASHQISYTETQVRQFLEASANLAKSRNGQLAIVWKESGIPSISNLWRDCADEISSRIGVQYRLMDIDFMAYSLIHEPSSFDVVAAPNLFGDVLADLGAALLGSRGVSYSGNFNANGASVYQTNHGSAYDLAGTDRANPVGQILSLSMMLRECFAMGHVSQAIEEAVRMVWGKGFSTDDLVFPNAKYIGTREMGTRIAEQAADLLVQSGISGELQQSKVGSVSL